MEIQESLYRISAGWAPRYAAGGVDHQLFGAVDWRLSRKWSVGTETALMWDGSGLVVQGYGRYRLRGKLQSRGFEEKMYLGMGWIVRHAIWDPGCAQSCREWRGAPLVQIGYGRDVLVWSAIHAGLQLEIRLGLVGGDVLSRMSTGALGMSEVRTDRVMLEWRGGFFWF